MGGDCGSWPDPQHFEGQTPDFNSTGAWTRQYLGSQTQLSSYVYPWHASVTINHGFTVSSAAKPPRPHFDHVEQHGWFYCLPTFRQAMFPPPNSVLKEHFSVVSNAISKKDDNHSAGQQYLQKQLLVFDQTGDQTTMIYSSGIGDPPLHYLSHWKENQAETSIFRPQQDGNNMMGNADTLLMDDFIDISEFDEDRVSDLQSEMHEDTVELNALMYSDGSTDSDDDEDEVTSTDHSPSTLIVPDKQNGFAGLGEEVASSDEELTKRQKLSDGGNVITKKDGRITVSHGTFSVDDDTESRYGSAEKCNSGKTRSLAGKKRARKDSIRETVRTLQSMIPCGKGATPIEVIDEAINFLISLKLKANSLGFESSTAMCIISWYSVKEGDVRFIEDGAPIPQPWMQHLLDITLHLTVISMDGSVLEYLGQHWVDEVRLELDVGRQCLEIILSVKN